MRWRNQIFGILSFVVAGLLLAIFKETSWAIFVERFLEEVAHSLHIERAAMIAALSQILLGGGILWAALYFAFRVGRAERPSAPDPAIEAARLHAEAIRAQTEALRPSTPSDRALPIFDPAWSRNAMLGAALWRVCFGKWSEPKMPETIMVLEEAAARIRQHAYEGRLPIWAKKKSAPRSTLYELVPPIFWRNHTILAAYSASSLSNDAFVMTTEALIVGEVKNSQTMIWGDFMTSSEAIEALCPAMP